MSVADTLKKLFKQEKNRAQKTEEEIIQSVAFVACEEKHNNLIQCYKTTLIGGCQDEMDNFWKCVNDKKVILKQKAKEFKQNQQTDSVNENTEL